MSIWNRLTSSFSGAPFFSPRGFLDRALMLFLLFAICHLAGLREYTCIISGTSPTGDPADTAASMLGIAYFATYSLALLAAPVFVIAAALLKLFGAGTHPRYDSSCMFSWGC
ncbi:MAG TPA: hypothetical protein PLU72_17275 [Candidatus Ozemobacteraceae bacterium]|nr:hypothetical protein [Candidatus Ozemobacteraceae bacterium]